LTDLAQQNLKEPERVDWDNAFKGSTYSAPPPALGPDEKPIVYSGKVADIKEIEGKGLDAGYLSYIIRFNIVGNGADGKEASAKVSTRVFTKKNESGEYVPIKGNPNSLAKFLNAAGLQAKPSSNSEYRAAVRMVNGKTIPFTIDWEAWSKETGEQVRGYSLFPEDPDRPGTKKSILKAGDILANETVVKSEVLFANARVKYFQTKGR
jgi:hypothetical protein